MDVCSKGLVRRASLSPGISTASQVDEDDTERPEIVGGRVVLFQALKQSSLAIWRKVECGATNNQISNEFRD